MNAKPIEITYDTKIINLGHQPGHTHGKTKLLQEAGFTNVEGFLFTEHGKENIKNLVKGQKDTLLLIGGAMMKSFPQDMAEILNFIKTDCPEVFVYTTTAADFPPDVTFPPSEEVVNQSAVTICKKLLKKV